ncbi:MAG: hypothetical protein RLZZ293_827 [Pseudomonadota bacterium]|jgi:putative ubiquitin-RnfH superfamily antitoxin RatB of RatAB toxin-antitoxin module
MLHIEVAFASPNLQKIIACMVADDCSIKQAILSSGIQQLFPEYQLLDLPVGIFGKRQFDPDKYQLQNGDRIEIYRPLSKTPNQQRLQRAKQSK